MASNITVYDGTWDGTTLKLQPNQPVKRLNPDGNYEQDYKYVILGSFAESTMPAIGDASPDLAHPELKFNGARVEPHTAPDHVFVTHFYRKPESLTTPPTGTVTFESNAAFRELPLQKAVEDMRITAPKKKELEAQKKSSFSFPTLTFTRTEILSSVVFTQSLIVKNVGTLDSPQGLGGASADKWLKIGLTYRQTGDNIEYRQEWMYDEFGWNDLATLYNNAATTTTT